MVILTMSGDYDCAWQDNKKDNGRDNGRDNDKDNGSDNGDDDVVDNMGDSKWLIVAWGTKPEQDKTEEEEEKKTGIVGHGTVLGLYQAPNCPIGP